MSDAAVIYIIGVIVGFYAGWSVKLWLEAESGNDKRKDGNGDN